MYDEFINWLYLYFTDCKTCGSFFSINPIENPFQIIERTRTAVHRASLYFLIILIEYLIIKNIYLKVIIKVHASVFISVTERKKPSDTVDGITHNTISDEKKESDVEDISTVDEIFSSILFGEVDKSNKRREEHVNRRGSQSRVRRPDVPVPSGLGDRSQLSLDINSTQERGRQRGTLSPDGSISRRVGIIRLHSDVEVDGGSDEVEGATARERKSSEKGKCFVFSVGYKFISVTFLNHIYIKIHRKTGCHNVIK